MDALGIDTADIGLPGAGPQVARDVERLARAIAEGRLTIRRQLRGADDGRRHQADRRDPAADRRADRVRRLHRVEPDPAVRGRLDARLPAEVHRGRARLRRQGRHHGDVRHRRTRPGPIPSRCGRCSRPRFAPGATRLCVADTVGHATPNGAKAVVRFVKSLVAELGVDVGIDWHGHRDRGFGVASSIAALEAGATRLHGAALGIGERCGNTPIDLLMVNLVMMGYRDNDLTSAAGLLRRRWRDACDVPDRAQLSGDRRRRVPDRDRRPRRRRRQGVPEGRPRADGRGLRGGAGEPGRPAAGDRGRPDVGTVERDLLAREPRPAGDRRDRRSHLRRGRRRRTGR